jgi:dolichol-phosphate mannosyltransferase
MNQTSKYRFTIISPVYNEEGNVRRLAEELGKFMEISKEPSVCVLFVNDGSADNSLQLIKDECSKRKNFFYISLSHRTGLSGAIKAGFDNCFSDFVGYIDADLQTTPEDFNLLLPYIIDYPLVMGIRANRKDSGWKNFQSKFANGFRKMFTHDGAQDTGCPLKIMQTAYAKRIPMFTGMHRFFPALIQLQEGGKMKQIPVRHFPRTAGVSKYNVWNRLIGPLKDCFAYRWMKKRYINYSVGEQNINS